MLGKLLKYDLRQIYPRFLAMLLIPFTLTILALFARFNAKGWPAVLVVTLGTIGVIVALTLYITFTISYTHKALVGKQSYLTFTLPVSTDQIALSKILLAFILGVYTVALIAYTIYIPVVKLSLPIALRDGSLEVTGASGVNGFVSLVVGSISASAVIQSLATLPIVLCCVCLANVPFFKYRNIGVAAGIIGYIAFNYILGGVEMLLMLPHFISLNPGKLQSAIQAASTIKNIAFSTNVVMIVAGVAAYMAAVWLIRKHRAI
jgi:putative effector of murein hydrolase LrgA (UPF0299 family)